VKRAAIWALAAVAASVLTSCAQSTTQSTAQRTAAQQAPRPADHARAAPVRAQHAPAAERAVSRPAPNRCARNAAPQKVIVSIRRQHLWMCAGHRVVRQSAVTTGIVGQYTNTPTGNYVIQGRVRDTTLTLNTGATYAVRYWIPFDGPLFGFHDASWQTFPYGSGRYKTQGSHGCVHMPLAAIAFLYRWSARPTAVHIS
jgi:hypothetical protein